MFIRPHPPTMDSINGDSKKLFLFFRFKVSIEGLIVDHMTDRHINPYPANVNNMASSYQC